MNYLAALVKLMSVNEMKKSLTKKFHSQRVNEPGTKILSDDLPHHVSPGSPKLRLRLFTLPYFALFLGLALSGCSAVNVDHAGTVSAESTLVGKINSSFGTSPSGASVYSVPVEVPPGIQRSAPHLSLDYASHGSVNKLGVGWLLSGPSSITRCSAIPAVDGYRGAIRFDQNDRFCLDGHRLIKVGNTNGSQDAEYTAPGSIYRTELDTWRRITASSQACGNGPCSFTVEASDGSILSFGTTNDSRILQSNGSSVRTWAVAKVSDNNRNTLTYQYTAEPVSGQSFQGDGQYYLKSISYGANEATGSGNDRQIAFQYELRPDVGYSYVGGGTVITRARLSQITSTIAGASRMYKIDYGNPSAATFRSLIRSITECTDTPSGSACKPATKFSWQESPLSVEMANLTPSLAKTYQAMLPGDLNGDGRGDLLQITLSGSVAIADPFVSNGTDLNQCGSKTSIPATSDTKFIPMDVNGDGRLDVVTVDVTNNQLMLTPWITGIQNCQMVRGPVTQGPANGSPGFEWPMDVDGNGNTDLVVAWEDETRRQVKLVAFISDGTHLTAGDTSFLAITPGETRYWPMDVNADGMVDLVYGQSVNQTMRLSSAVNQAGSFAESGAGSTTIDNSLTIDFWPLDVNGDGNVDLVQGSESGGRLALTTYQSTGMGGFVAGQPKITGVDSSRQLGFWSMDITGDGSTDLVLAEESSGTIALQAFLASGDGLTAAQNLGSSLTSDDYSSVWPLDVNGDGRVDLIQGRTNSAYMNFQSWLAQGGKPDLLASGVDGYGRKITFSYQPMSNASVYTPGDLADQDAAAGLGFGYRNTPSAGPFQPVSGGVLHLVSETVESVDSSINPLGYEYSTRWSYSGALIDRSGRGWLGFKTVSSLVLEDGLKTINTYNQIFPETGTTASTETQCVATSDIEKPDPQCPSGSTGTTLTMSTTDYTVVQTASGLSTGTPEVVQALKTQVRMDSYNYGVYESSRSKLFEHDAYGNVTMLAKTGQYDRASSPPENSGITYYCADYADDPTKLWRFGMVLDAKVSTTKSSCTNFAVTAYDPNADLQLQRLTYTADQRSNLASRGGLDNTNKVWLTSSYGYDDYGNVSSVTGPGVLPTKTTYDDTLHTFKARVDYPEGLSETYSFDPLTGTLVGMQHQNGAVSVSCLDPLGRLQKTQATPPSGSSASSDNCIPSNATGDRAAFASAEVATTRSVSWVASPTTGVKHIVSQLQSWSDPDDQLQTTALVDGRGRSRILITKGNSSTPHFTCSEFDEDNRTIGASVPSFSTEPLPDCSALTKDQWLVTHFDTYQRVRANISPDAMGAESTTEFAWHSNTQMKATQASQSSSPYVREVTFDWFNGERKPISMTVPGTSMTSTYAWDGLGRLVSSIDPPTAAAPAGVATRLTYDSMGRRLTVSNPDQTNPATENNPVWAAKYDPATGNLSSVTDASGQEQKLTYDGLGRMTSKVLSDGSKITWSYDGPNYGKGRVWKVTGVAADGSISYQLTYGYDASGNVTSKTTEFPADKLTFTMAFDYDPMKRLHRVTWPDGTSEQRVYADDNLVSIDFNGTSIATWQDHTALGSPLNAIYGNGSSASWSYAPTGQTLTASLTDKAGKAVLKNVLSWDQLWNLRAIDDQVKLGAVDRSQKFSYVNQRLVEAQAPDLYGKLSYNYDASGNVTEQGDTSFTYRAHQVQSGTNAGVVNYAAKYDGNGNVSTRKIGNSDWSFSYDPQNRLTRVEESGITTLQVPIYGPKGERLKKIDAAGGQTWYVSPHFRVVERNGTWTYTRLFRSDNAVVAAVTAEGNGTVEGSVVDTLYLHQDYLNSTTLTTDTVGQVSSQVVYVPWGSPSTQGTAGPDNFREKFQGRELDSVASNGQNGIYYFGARYYDPSVGRFLSPDNQLGSDLLRQDAQNRFAFALNNPVTVIDPTGHFSISAVIGSVVDVGLVIGGLAVDILSEGALEPVGGALIGAGINGLQYSVTHGNHFSWSQYALQNGVGAAMGVATGGLGSVGDAAEGAAEAGVEAGVEESAATASSSVAEDVSEDSLSDASDSMNMDEHGSDSKTNSADEEDDVSSCEGNSFPAGTLVWTRKGGTRIETLKHGDHVLGLSQRNPVVEEEAVGSVFTGEAEQLVSVVLSDGMQNETISATPIHPFWTRDIGWVDAKDLKPGNQVFSASGNWLDVLSTQTVAHGGTVFNFSVDEAHTYFVGELGAWVHNPKGAGWCDIGGRHYQNTKNVEKKLVESNHFPASSSYTGTPYDSVPYGWRPAVNMDYVDHLETESWGNSYSAQAWRAKQTALMNKGQFAKAMAMDIEDMKVITQSATGDRHYLANGMQQAVEYAAQPNAYLGNNPFISQAEKNALIALIWK